MGMTSDNGLCIYIQLDAWTRVLSITRSTVCAIDVA